MDLSKLKGAEIIYHQNQNLKNKLLMDIPNTQAHLLLEFRGKGINAYCIELGSTKRYCISKNLNQEKAEKVVHIILDNKERQAFKDLNLKKLTNHLINSLN